MADNALDAPGAPSYGHPIAAIFLMVFKYTAIFFYIFCGWLPTNFVINFCVITFLLVCDFWTVRALLELRQPAPARAPPPRRPPAAARPRRPTLPQVKNVSGRLLVGLRWWNEVSESGGSDWKFESLEQGQREVNKHDSRVFWLVTYTTPAVWAVLGLIALLKLNLDYLLLVVIAVLLNGANLMGFIKCSKAAQAQLKGVTSGLISSGFKASGAPVRAGCCVCGRGAGPPSGSGTARSGRVDSRLGGVGRGAGVDRARRGSVPQWRAVMRGGFLLTRGPLMWAQAYFGRG
jgi:hypothetical protein